jgi:hypothetical protein
MQVRKLALGGAVVLALGIGLAPYVYWSRGPSLPPERGAVVSASDYSLSGPYAHENLTVFLIHGPETLPGKNFLTLQEGLEQHKVVMRETGNVNELSVENLSPDEEVYIQSGDIVKGGQQDRTLTYDLVAAPRSGQVRLASFCVEHGRWQQRGNESVAIFDSSSSTLNTKELKLAAKYRGGGGQPAVWAKVSEAQSRLSANLALPVQSSASESSLQLSLENAKLRQSEEKYLDKLADVVKDKTDVIGYAFAINGKINSADVYASQALFRKLWPKLLRASAAEAIAVLDQEQKKEPLTAEGVKAFLTAAEKGKTSTEPVTERIQVIVQETEGSVLFDTCDRKHDNRVIHRNYLAK